MHAPTQAYVCAFVNMYGEHVLKNILNISLARFKYDH